MANVENLFKPAPGSRPKAACEIRPEGVIAARPGKKHGEIVTAFAPLPEGAVAPGLKVPNLVDAHAVGAALESAMESLGSHSKEMTLVVPDGAARVLLLDFDELPAKRQEALSVVRFRLRKMVPFDVETAAVSYQVMAEKDGQLNVLVTVMPAEVLAEYESRGSRCRIRTGRGAAEHAGGCCGRRGRQRHADGESQRRFCNHGGYTRR